MDALIETCIERKKFLGSTGVHDQAFDALGNHGNRVVKGLMLALLFGLTTFFSNSTIILTACV